MSDGYRELEQRISRGMSAVKLLLERKDAKIFRLETDLRENQVALRDTIRRLEMFSDQAHDMKTEIAVLKERMDSTKATAENASKAVEKTMSDRRLNVEKLKSLAPIIATAITAVASLIITLLNMVLK